MIIPRVVDCHVHLRRGEELREVLPYTANTCCRAIVMPPNRPPTVDTLDTYLEYSDDVRSANEAFPDLDLRLAFEVTDSTTPDVVREIVGAGASVAKVNLTRVNVIPGLMDVFRSVVDAGIPLCIHGSDSGCRHLGIVRGLVNILPTDWLVLEHIHCEQEVEFCLSFGVHATITAHHLIEIRKDALNDADLYCHPIPSGIRRDRSAVQIAATIFPYHTRFGDLFMFGSDSAPHPAEAKLTKPPAAGVFSAPWAIEVVCSALGSMPGGPEAIPEFTSGTACRFYGWDPPTGTIDVSDEISDPKIARLAGEAHHAAVGKG